MKGGSLAGRGTVKGTENPRCCEVPGGGWPGAATEERSEASLGEWKTRHCIVEYFSPGVHHKY